jgi:hypothetical protein
MPKSHKPYPPEFKQRLIDLVRAGRNPEELAEQFEPSALRRWTPMRRLIENLRRPLNFGEWKVERLTPATIALLLGQRLAAVRWCPPQYRRRRRSAAQRGRVRHRRGRVPVLTSPRPLSPSPERRPALHGSMGWNGDAGQTEALSPPLVTVWWIRDRLSQVTPSSPDASPGRYWSARASLRSPSSRSPSRTSPRSRSAASARGAAPAGCGLPTGPTVRSSRAPWRHGCHGGPREANGVELRQRLQFRG